MVKLRMKKYVFLLGILQFCYLGLSAALEFANRDSTIVLYTGSQLTHAAPLSGWYGRSITKGSDTVTLDTTDPITYSLAPEDLVVSNSNALLYGIKNNSNAIIKDVLDLRTDSNAFAYDIKNNSNAFSYMIKNNSNAIVKNTADIRTNSNAFSFMIKNNSNAIVKDVLDLRTDSNAFAYEIKNNSNAFSYMIKNNSNALVYGIKNNSNAITFLQVWVKNNSNALLYGIKNNSNALVYGIKNNSNALLYGIKNNSNALLYGIKNNSNALLYGIKNNSNALLYGIKNNSNALVYGIKNNSQAIMLYDRYFETIDHGYQYVGNRTYVGLGSVSAKDLETRYIGRTYRLNCDIFLSQNHTLTLPNDCICLDGNGHVINFARENDSSLIVLPASSTITTTNVVLRGFNAGNVSYQGTSNLIFADGTTIELFDNQDLSRTWSFMGNTVLSGFGNKLNLVARKDMINVLGNTSRLVIQDANITGLRNNNLHAINPSTGITLRNDTLALDHNYSYSMGTIKFEQDTEFTGTNAFTLETAYGSTIANDSVLKFDIGTTFSYAPRRADKGQLIMQDISSILFLNGMALDITITGMQLTKGVLMLDHRSYVNNIGPRSAIATSEGLIFGDGTLANDLTIQMLPGGNIEMSSGVLVYDNIVTSLA